MVRARWSPVCLLIALALAWWPERSAQADAAVVPGGVRVDGVAAIVGRHTGGQGVGLLLRSDVELTARLALAGQRPESVAHVLLPRDLLRASFDQLLGEVLIAREAERLRVATPTELDLAREMDRIARDVGGTDKLRALVRALGGDMAEIEAVARRRALVGGFLQANLEGTTVITDGEVDRAYEAEEHPFAGEPLEDIREELRAWLAQRSLQRAVRRWVTVLRARTPHRVLVDYGENRARSDSADPASARPSERSSEQLL